MSTSISSTAAPDAGSVTPSLSPGAATVDPLVRAQLFALLDIAAAYHDQLAAATKMLRGIRASGSELVSIDPLTVPGAETILREWAESRGRKVRESVSEYTAEYCRLSPCLAEAREYGGSIRAVRIDGIASLQWPMVIHGGKS